jgi:hypothetical protein
MITELHALVLVAFAHAINALPWIAVAVAIGLIAWIVGVLLIALRRGRKPVEHARPDTIEARRRLGE